MQIQSLLKQSRSIWGPKKLELPGIIACMGKIFGDICRFSRDAKKDKKIHTDQELKKELGNIIFSTIRWCDDLGYKPEECIQEAIQCQERFKK